MLSLTCDPEKLIFLSTGFKWQLKNGSIYARIMLILANIKISTQT